MKGVVKKIKRQAIDGERVISKPVSDKGLPSRTYKEFSSPINTQTTQFFRRTEDLNMSSRVTHEEQISTGKDA